MSMEKANKLLKELKPLKTDMYNKDFLLTWKQSFDEIKAVILTAQILEEYYSANVSCRVFDGGISISNFRDQSTRTRFSFAKASSLLGLNLVDMDESKTQIAHGETVRETANMISFLTEVIGIRDDLFLGYGHKYMTEVSQAVQDGYKDGVLPQRPAVLNLQCDLDHPTQSMADLIHLIDTFGGIQNLKGKKIAMTWAFSPAYGKPLSVPQGIIGLMTRFGMEVAFAHPEGYDVVEDIVKIGKKNAKESGGKFTHVNSMEEAFQDADAVYPKSWAPVTVMQKRTELLVSGKAGKTEMAALEKECIANNSRFKNWECTEKLMKLTRGGKAVYMHCLPADISGENCAEGEVQKSVFDRYLTPLYKEARHKPYVMAAMMLLTRFKNVPNLLARLRDRKETRRFE